MFAVGPAIEGAQRTRLARMRSERDAAAVTQALVELQVFARQGEPMIEPTIFAGRAYPVAGTRT